MRVLSGGDTVDLDQAPSVLSGIVPSADLTAVDVEVSTAQPDGQDHFGSGLAVCAAPPAGLQRVAATSALNTEELKTVTATCPAGKHLVGIGGRVTGGRGNVVIDDWRPGATLASATVTGIARPGFADAWSLAAYAVCVTR
ncbi:MAG TPA: hypothetical protein VF533_13095 [Solirubrobacteraceae bacterium]